MLRQFSTRRIVAFFLIDWLGTLGMFVLAAFLRVRLGELPTDFIRFLQAIQIEIGRGWEIVAMGDLLQVPVFVVVSIIWPFFFITFSVYDGRHNETLKAELTNVFMAVCVSITTLAGILYFTYRETPRVLVLIFFVLDLSLLIGSRVVLWGIRRASNGRLRDQRRKVLLIGAGPVGRTAVEQIRRFAWGDLDLLGFLDDDPQKQGQMIEGLPVLGTLDQAPAVIQQHHVQDALVALPLRAHERLVEICDQLHNQSVRVHVIPDLFALSFPNATLDGFGGIPVIDLGRPGLQGLQRFSKRAFDVVAVSVGLVFLSPLMLMIALLVALDSPGPVIYRQKRIGENGRMFTMYKYRTMRVGADPEIHKAHVTRLIRENLSPEQLAGGGGSSLKLENDPRITRLGRILRKSSLDELPQLINVLRGEMSLVGPRPPLPYEVELYQGWHKRRFEAPPGITGLWQVHGRNRVSFDEMVRMDLEYIEHQSIWLDLSILMKTPWALISSKGAG